MYFNILFIPLMAKFQSSVSHNPPEIILISWFGAQETFMISVENSFVA